MNNALETLNALLAKFEQYAKDDKAMEARFGAMDTPDADLTMNHYGARAQAWRDAARTVREQITALYTHQSHFDAEGKPTGWWKPVRGDVIRGFDAVFIHSTAGGDMVQYECFTCSMHAIGGGSHSLENWIRDFIPVKEVLSSG